MLPGSDVYYADPVRHVKTAGDELEYLSVDDLDRNLAELLVLFCSVLSLKYGGVESWRKKLV